MRIKGEKGCFGSSCKVLTPEGEQYIDTLLIGDEVYCREVREHENQALYHFSYWDGELSATRNHWVQNQFGAFVEIGTLTCEDAIMDRNGHLRPFIGSVPTGKDVIYSIIVEPYHTLIVNGIRAHNGGLGLEPYQTAISGKKGGKGGCGTVRPAVESKNTLQSRSTAAVLDLISEGEIEGLVNGKQSIFFDETPLQNDKGQDNFSGVEYSEHTGTPTQSFIKGFNAVEREIPVGIELTKPNTLTRTITDSEVDAVRVKLRIPQLTFQDLTTGDLKGSSLQFDAYVKVDGGSFKRVVLRRVWKTTSNPTSSVVGLRVTITKKLSGLPWARIKGSVDMRYRKVGESTWTDVKAKSVGGKIGGKGTGGRMPGYGKNSGGSTGVSPNGVTGKKRYTQTWYFTGSGMMFQITGLEEGSYEIEALSGSISKIEGLVPAPAKISGKTTSPYERSYRIALPEGGAP